MKTYQPKVVTQKAHDVVVVGGGVAGVAAALAARRLGCSVLLMEKTCVLGGLATIGLVNFFVPMCDGRGHQMLKGMAEEFLRESVSMGYDTLNDAWKDGEPKEPTTLRYETFFSPQIYALQMIDRLIKEGVDVLYDVTVEDVDVTNGYVDGIYALCEEGHAYFPAKEFIDASGVSLLYERAGAPTTIGNNYFTYHCHVADIETCKKVVETNNIRYLTKWVHGGNANLWGENHPKDMPPLHGETTEHVTDYVIRNQQLLLSKIDAPRTSRDIVTLPTMPQFREVRRINAEYTMTEDDANKHFDDAVTALCDSNPSMKERQFEIPYRSLYINDYDNLIACGRNISADGYMWDLTRVIPPAIVTGQAAGTAAAIAIQGGYTIPSVPMNKLQPSLEKQNVLVHFDDAWVEK